MALVLVLASALSSLWLSRWQALVACSLAVMGFNYSFVPPRGTLSVDLQADVLLLGTLLLVGGMVSVLTTRQRELLARERSHLERLEQAQAWGDALREADDPATCAPALQSLLAQITDAPASLWLAPSPGDEATEGHLWGPATAVQQEGLRHCAQAAQALGPDTGRFEQQSHTYLPLRGRARGLGAARVDLAAGPQTAPLRQHAQALCDQMGLALERAAALRSASAAREAAQVHALRNTLLAAIAHDHRTPLASILGAASSLLAQDDRLSAGQRQRLANTIVDEAAQLTRMTDNTLQLARLDSPGLVLHRDWESVEEIVGAVLARVRGRRPGRVVTVAIAPDLPLLRCDAVLMAQMLENLIDNALRHGDGTPVDIVAERRDTRVALTVGDHGPGVPPALQTRIFDLFYRAQGGRGAGVGLALCQAIARVHGGRLAYRDRPGGGALFEYTWTAEPAP